MANTKVRRLGKYFPRNNFPANSARKRKETLFVIAFARMYKRTQHGKTLQMARELYMNGYGIADLVSLEITRDKRTGKTKAPQVVSFEMKLSDWRRAIQQGFRYRFFSNKSIVVLPLAEAVKAMELIKTFRVLYLGLWGFDVKRGEILQYYTPPMRRALNPLANRKAIDFLRSTL
jgi:hypothetical protein